VDRFLPLIIFLIIIISLGFSAYKLRDRFAILREFIQFLGERKLWWLMPILIIFALAGLFVVITGNSAVGAFIYTLF